MQYKLVQVYTRLAASENICNTTHSVLAHYHNHNHHRDLRWLGFTCNTADRRRGWSYICWYFDPPKYFSFLHGTVFAWSASSLNQVSPLVYLLYTEQEDLRIITTTTTTTKMAWGKTSTLYTDLKTTIASTSPQPMGGHVQCGPWQHCGCNFIIWYQQQTNYSLCVPCLLLSIHSL